MRKKVTLGILGGGQLGRMSAIAAARLGIPVIIFCPEQDCPASYVAKETITASYDDHDSLRLLSEKTDVISYEFENIPLKTIEYLEELKPGSILPDKKLLDASQDRIKEKTFLNNLGIKTTQWCKFTEIEDLKNTLNDWKTTSFIIKTARFGYDGKGQLFCTSDNIENNTSLNDFLTKHNNQHLIIEDTVDFRCEASIIVARDKKEKTVVYGPMLNQHKSHILHKTTYPAALPQSTKSRAIDMGRQLADSINLTGVLTLELFITKDNRLLANEIAPRTHNSGHWTIDACAVSQFENHVRTVCGLDVGPSTAHSGAEMLNLVGDDIDLADSHMSREGACVHLYGKYDVREGRKMGHITLLQDLKERKSS
jgi:5-(carboxyamino)imidazole ribonucleotide synthase